MELKLNSRLARGKTILSIQELLEEYRNHHRLMETKNPKGKGAFSTFAGQDEDGNSAPSDSKKKI